MRTPWAWAATWAVTRRVEREVGTPIGPRRAAESQRNTIALGRDATGITVTSFEAPVAGGTIEVLRYAPDAEAALPAHLLLHGGSFWAGTLALVDGRAREIAAGTNRVVLTVDYRRAPEHPYPVPIDDSQAALHWAHDHAAELGIDPARLSLAGQSCGGALAAAVALRERDRGDAGIGLRCVVLETPALDLTMSQPSIRQHSRSGVVTWRSLAEGYAFYAPDPADRRDPQCSPLLAESVAGLAPTVVLAAEHDPLRDEALAFGARLRAARVPVEVVLARAHAHATVHVGGRWFESATDYRAQVDAAMVRLAG
jgi:acetyl esterase